MPCRKPVMAAAAIQKPKMAPSHVLRDVLS